MALTLSIAQKICTSREYAMIRRNLPPEVDELDDMKELASRIHQIRIKLMEARSAIEKAVPQERTALARTHRRVLTRSNERHQMRYQLLDTALRRLLARRNELKKKQQRERQVAVAASAMATRALPRPSCA